MHTGPAACLLAVCCASAVVSADAQVVRGRVVDPETGQPLTAVTVRAGALTAVTDTAGRFALEAPSPDTVSLHLRRIGYSARDTLLHLGGYDAIHVLLTMTALPARLDTVSVRASGDVPGALTEFEDRRIRGVGHFITREDLRKQDDRTFADVLRARLPNLAFEPIGSAILLYNPSQQAPGALKPGGFLPTGLQQNPYDLHSSRICYVQVVVDGNPIYRVGPHEEPPDFALLRTQDFDGVEYYSQPSRTPVQYRSSGALCGTLIFWSRRK